MLIFLIKKKKFLNFMFPLCEPLSSPIETNAFFYTNLLFVIDFFPDVAANAE